VAFSRIARLVFNGDQVVQLAFADEHALMQNADAVANLLHLPEQMRAEEHGDPARFEAQDQVADFARARRDRRPPSARRARATRLLNQRLREADALQHPFE
jgi:hypothetical protein